MGFFFFFFSFFHLPLGAFDLISFLDMFPSISSFHKDFWLLESCITRIMDLIDSVASSCIMIPHKEPSQRPFQALREQSNEKTIKPRKPGSQSY